MINSSGSCRAEIAKKAKMALVSENNLDAVTNQLDITAISSIEPAILKIKSEKLPSRKNL